MASLSLLENLQLNDKKDNNNDNTFQTLLFWVREHSKGKQKACWEGIQLDRVTLKNGDGVMVAKTNSLFFNDYDTWNNYALAC